MIINLRGTSGSGKTTLVRQVMSLLGPRVRVRAKGKKRILAYIAAHPKSGEKSVAFIGSYENPTGGCDTLPDMDTIFGLVREAHQRGFHVLFEGLLISADQKRAFGLHEEGLPLEVVCLNVPLDLCVASVNLRRQKKRGPDAPLVDPKNTESKWHQTQKAARWLTERGVKVGWYDREQALRRLCDVFSLEFPENLYPQHEAGVGEENDGQGDLPEAADGVVPSAPSQLGAVEADPRSLAAPGEEAVPAG